MKRLMPMLIILGVVCVHANAATRNVDYDSGTDDTSASPWRTLKFAVDNADAGDEIVLAKGTHVLGANVTVDKQLAIRGEGENWETLLVSDKTVRTLSFTSGSENGIFHNLTLPGSKSPDDNYSEIYFNPNTAVTISNVVFRSIGTNPTACSQSYLMYATGRPTFKNVWVTNCLLKANFFYMRCGSNPLLFENCVFSGNSTSAVGDMLWIGWSTPIIRNCTVANNTLYSGDAVMITSGYTVTMENCLIWGNEDLTGKERNVNITAKYTTQFKNICTHPIDGWSGTGHVTGDPFILSDGFRVSVASSCRKSGDPSSSTAFDILGTPRGAKPTIGAYEYVDDCPFTVTVTQTGTFGRLPDSVTLTASASGDFATPMEYSWDYDGDGVIDATGSETTIGRPGRFRPIVYAKDALGRQTAEYVESQVIVHSEGKDTFYVDGATGSPDNQGLSADKPWKRLEYAVAQDIVLDGDEIVLAKGTLLLSGEVAVNKALTVRGSGTKEETILASAGTTVQRLKATVAGSTFHTFTMAGSKDGSASSEVYLAISKAVVVSNIVVRSIGESPAVCTQTPLWYTEGTGSVFADVWATNCLFKTTFVNFRNAKSVSNFVVANNSSAEGSTCLIQFQHCSPEVKNCTIVNNTLFGGAAIYVISNSEGPSLYNNIVWNNNVTGGGSVKTLANFSCDAKYTKNFHHTCTSPISAWQSGNDNFDSDPQFMEDGLHFLASSPCNRTGDPDHATPFDIEGQARGDTPSVGAFEYVAPPGLVCGIEVLSDSVVSQPQKLRLKCSVEGTPTGTLTYSWDLDGDDVPELFGDEIEIADVGVYQPTVSVFDDGVLKASATTGGKLGVHVNGKAMYYVDYALGDDANLGMGPGTDALKTLSAAAGHPLLLAGDEVVLAKGDHVLASSVQFLKPVHVHGAGENWETRLIGSGANCDVQLNTAGVVFSSLSIPGAQSDAGYPVQFVVSGASTVSNVMATAFGGNQKPCSKIFQVRAPGATFAHLWVTNCLFTSHGLYSESSGIFENCLFADNRIAASDPQATRVLYHINGFTLVLRYCTIANNETYDAEPVFFTGNGITPEFVNCILWNNVDKKTDTVRSIGFDLTPKKDKFWYSCLNDTNNLTDASNITDDPRFRNAAGRDYRLRVDSPCRNTGLDGAWSEGTTDLLGNPQRFGKQSDRGCCELQNGYGTAIIVR